MELSVQILIGILMFLLTIISTLSFRLLVNIRKDIDAHITNQDLHVNETLKALLKKILVNGNNGGKPK